MQEGSYKNTRRLVALSSMVICIMGFIACSDTATDSEASDTGISDASSDTGEDVDADDEPDADNEPDADGDVGEDSDAESCDDCVHCIAPGEECGSDSECCSSGCGPDNACECLPVALPCTESSECCTGVCAVGGDDDQAICI